MAPLKSSLSKSASKLLGVFRDRDLSLRGLVQKSRFINPFSVAQFYFGDSRDGDLTASGGTVTLSSQPSPAAPGGVCSSFRVSDLTSTRITISAPHGNNVFTAGDKVLLYQRNTSVPESNKVGTYSIHDVASVPSTTTIDISDSYAGTVPGSESISTPSFKEDSSGPSPSVAANRVYVVRVAQFGTATVNGGTVTTAQDSTHAGIVAIAAQTSITVSSGAITAAGLGYYAGDGAPSGPPISSPNSGGKGQSYNTEPWTGANNPAVPGHTNTPAYEIGGGGGAHNPGSFSGGGGGGGSIMAGAAGGGDGPEEGAGAAGGAYPTPRRDTTGASRLSIGGGGGGGADTTGIEGGRGGGIVLLFAPSITISGGTVSARGLATPTNSASAVDSGGGGGGGTVLIRGETVALGTDLVTSKGGDQGGTHTPAGYGGAGGGGMVAVYAPSITGTVTNTTAGSTSQNPSYYSSSWVV